MEKDVKANPSVTPNATPNAKMDANAAEPKKSNFNSKNLVVIFLAAIVLVILIFVAFKLKTTPPTATQTTQTSSQAPTPVVADATMSLQLNQNTPASGAAAPTTVNVNIDPGTHNVTCAQFELSYDPKVLSNFQITPGKLFTNPLLLPVGNPDAVKGLYPYAICMQPNGKPISGNGTVAVVSFTVNPGAKGQTTISFVGKSLISAASVTPSVLKSTQNLTFPLPQ